MNDSSYSQKGAFPIFLQQTSGKKIELKNILSQLKKRYNLKNYERFIFTDIGAGEGILTYPITKFLSKKVNCDVYCIEPSNLIDTLKKRFHTMQKIHFINKGAEETKIPNSDFILLSHSMGYVKDRKKLAESLTNSLNKKGKILFVGTDPESTDMKFRKALIPQKRKKTKKVNIFDCFEEKGMKVSREYAFADIYLKDVFQRNEKGKGLMSFYYHKPTKEISETETNHFIETARKFASGNKLIKKIQFIWVEK